MIAIKFDGTTEMCVYFISINILILFNVSNQEVALATTVHLTFSNVYITIKRLVMFMSYSI